MSEEITGSIGGSISYAEKVYVLCVDQESGAYAAFSSLNHTNYVTGHTREAAIAAYAEKFIQSIRFVEIGNK